MSRGPGKIEQAIEAAFRDHPNSTFNVSELARHAYPGVNRIEKKHRVAILRAADKVASRIWWMGRRRAAKGSEVVYSNQCDVRSMALAQLRTHYPAHSAEAAARMWDDPRHRIHKEAVEGAWLWLIAEHNRAARDGDHQRQAELQAALDVETAHREKLRATLSAALGARG